MQLLPNDPSRLVIPDSPDVEQSKQWFRDTLRGKNTKHQILEVEQHQRAEITSTRDLKLLDPWLDPDSTKKKVGSKFPFIGFRVLRKEPEIHFYYNKYAICDLRYPHLPWQVYGWSPEGYLKNLKRYIFKLLPRRHGKSTDDLGKGTSLMCIYGVTRRDPLMRYFCPVKEQGLANVWQALVHMTYNLPGVNQDKSKGVVTWPTPLLDAPKSKATIRFLGTRGGSKTGVGGYSDITIFDEMEFYGIPFINDVGFAQSFDREGIVVGSSTPYNLGVIDYYVDEGIKRMKIAAGLKKGQTFDPKDVPSDVNDWHVVTGDCWSLNVYNKTELLKIKATLGDEEFAKSFECKNPDSVKLFYYKDTMKKAEEKGLVTTHPVFDPNVPVRVFYDFGIGEKTDRMAWSMWQFTELRPICIAGRVVVGKGFAEIVADVRKSKYGHLRFFEHLVPHDAKAREQSDGVEKIEKFKKELKKQGMFGWQRTRHLKRHSTPEMVVGEVNEVLKVATFHAIDAADIVDCLKNHKRVYIEKTGVVEDRASKTKYRDGADAARYATIDWKSREYVRRWEEYGYEGDSTRSPTDYYDFHPMEGSIMHIGPGSKNNDGWGDMDSNDEGW